MVSYHQTSLLRQFGLTAIEIKELDIYPIDPRANPIKDMVFLRNTTSRKGVMITHRQDPRYNGVGPLCSNCVSNFCFVPEEFVGFYNSYGSNEPVLENENFLCGFTPQSGHLYELVCDESQKYSIIDVTKNNSLNMIEE
jgi:hypothetical protein